LVQQLGSITETSRQVETIGLNSHNIIKELSNQKYEVTSPSGSFKEIKIDQNHPEGIILEMKDMSGALFEAEIFYDLIKL
jgi:hypothetical protein